MAKSSRSICLLIAEDDYVTDVRSAVVVVGNGYKQLTVISNLSMDESVLDQID